MTFIQPDQKRHPDGVHRDQYTRPIYVIGDQPKQTKCTLCDQHVEGWPYTRTTRFIDVLDDKFNLEQWKLRNVAKGLALRNDLMLKAASQINDDKALNEVVRAASEAAGSSAAATTGTAVHTLTEQVDRGEDVVIPPEVENDIAAYKREMAAHQLTVHEIEVSIAIDNVWLNKSSPGISGKFDRIVSTVEPCSICGKHRRIADLKTGRIDYGKSKIAMQLCTYSMGQRYDARSGDRTDLDVCQCVGIVIHLPARSGECEILKADLIGAREGLKLAFDVWQWRRHDGLVQPVPRPTVDAQLSIAPPELTGESVHALIHLAGDRQAIADLWEHATDAGVWAYGHELAANRRLAAIEGT